MRQINAVTAALSMLLFVIHLIWGGLELAGFVKGGNLVFKVISYLMVVLIALHTIIGIKLTMDTIKASRRSGASYIKANRLFWIRRISGLSLLIFILLHVFTFMGKNAGGVYLLNVFDAFQLAVQILMVISLLIHLLSNITPLRIALGIEDSAGVRVDIMLVLTVLLLLGGLAFIIYYLRWMAV